MIPPAGLIEQLRLSLDDEAPLLARDGGFVRTGLLPELDELRQLRDQSRRHIAALEERYRREAGIQSLKIRHNNMLGFYIEVNSIHAAKVPQGFVQRQSMAGATRYSTPELVQLESRIASAAEQALALELERFEILRQQVLQDGDAIAAAAAALAKLDHAAGLATLAIEQRYCRPLVDDSDAFLIRGGRHTVVEQALTRSSQSSSATIAIWVRPGRCGC